MNFDPGQASSRIEKMVSDARKRASEESKDMNIAPIFN